jgi:hypothetical protein
MDWQKINLVLFFLVTIAVAVRSYRRRRQWRRRDRQGPRTGDR